MSEIRVGEVFGPSSYCHVLREIILVFAAVEPLGERDAVSQPFSNLLRPRIASWRILLLPMPRLVAFLVPPNLSSGRVRCKRTLLHLCHSSP
jgi:hypothetical protein